MKLDFLSHRTMPLWQLILIASLAGGMAEIFWVSLYASFTSLTAATIAREVTASLLPAYATGVTGVWLGVMMHMLLSVVLGYAFALLVWRPFVRRHGMPATLAVSVMTLATVWTVNFFVVLPGLNPAFITLMPYSVTFASKIMFALAMGAALMWPEVRMTVRGRATSVHHAG